MMFQYLKYLWLLKPAAYPILSNLDEPNRPKDVAIDAARSGDLGITVTAAEA
jgi:hypothetical protein